MAEGATHVDNFANKRKFGFTLAEVLITLGIIGVVAAITIPTVINKTRNIETISRLKKIYSVLSQALNNAKAQDTDFSDFVIKNDLDSVKQFYYGVLKPNIKITKECINTGGCWAKDTKTLGGEVPYMFRAGKGMGADIIVFNTADGYSIIIDGYSRGQFGVNYTGNSESTGMFVFFVDINGTKAPNIVGRDTFMLVYDGDKLVPSGRDASDTYVNNSCSKSSGAYIGYCCLEKIIRDGWKIKY